MNEELTKLLAEVEKTLMLNRGEERDRKIDQFYDSISGMAEVIQTYDQRSAGTISRYVIIVAPESDIRCCIVSTIQYAVSMEMPDFMHIGRNGTSFTGS